MQTTPNHSPLGGANGFLAAIDMGSNSFRLEIATIRHGRYRRLHYLKDSVRLGAGLDATGCLSEEAMQRGLDCLSRFAVMLRELSGVTVRAVATQTLREARNREAFIARAEAVLGHRIEVISGREEARLIYAGVSHLAPPSDGTRLVIDIGGRSTEMILGQGYVPRTVESFQIGSVSLSMRYFPDGRFTEEGFRLAQIAAGAELEEAFSLFPRGSWDVAMGSSGTAGATADLLASSGVTDGRITMPALRWAIEKCLKAGSFEQLQLPGLKPERRAVLGGGLAILYTLCAQFGIEELLPAKGALRQGVIFDLDERLSSAKPRARNHDMRDESVKALQQRFGVDMAQSQRVGQVAESLYAALEPSAEPEALRELQWACALHEVGMVVSHHDHHRHSAYLMAHVDAPGFSQSQQRALAELILAQRGGLKKVDAAMSRAHFATRALALRLAAILCHARQLTPHEELGLAWAKPGKEVLLKVPKSWTERWPRTLFLLEQETSTWGHPFKLKLQRT